MTTKALSVLPAILPVFAAACLDGVSYEELPDPPTTPVAFTQLGGAHAVVATGGVQIISLSDPLALGIAGEATQGYELVPVGEQWPNMGKPDYRIRALVAGLGSFEIETKHGIASGMIASADFDHLAVAPANYRLDGASPFAIDVSRPEITVALFDETDARLVDGSLAIAGATQTAWDRATLAATAGAQTIHVTADSLPPQDVTVTLTSGADRGSWRVESRVEDGRLCYHAYAGATEVATAMPMVAHPDPAATNCEL